MKRLLAVAGLAAVVLAFAAEPAFAHAELEATTPESNAELPAGQPPTEVRLEFSEGVQVGDDAIALLDGNGDPIEDVGTAEHGDDDAVVVASLPTLEDGTYVVDWRVVSLDSHPISGAFTFTVGEATADDDTVAGLIGANGENKRGIGVTFGLTRALAFSSVLVLIGALAFLRVCDPEAGDDAPVRSLLWVSWVVAFVTAFAGIGLQAAYTTGQNLSGAWDGDALADVMDTRFGQSWLARGALLLLVIPFLRRPGRRYSPIVTGLTVVLGIALLATFTFAGHARTGRYILLATVTDLVHLGAAAVWIGGVAVLVTLLVRRAVPRDVPDVTTRFSHVAAPAIVVVAVSGVVQSWRQTAGLESVVDTTYGRLLLAKIGIVVMIVAAASVSRHIVRLWSTRQLAPAGPGAARVDTDPDDVRELRNAVVVEVGLAAVVLLVTAVLVNTPPARVAAQESAVEAPDAVAPNAGFNTILEDEGLRFDVGVAPALSGSNTVLVDVSQDGQPFEPIEIEGSLTESGRDLSLDVVLSPDAPGSYNGVVDIPFAGEWQLEVRALRTDIDQAVVTVAVDIG